MLRELGKASVMLLMVHILAAVLHEQAVVYLACLVELWQL